MSNTKCRNSDTEDVYRAQYDWDERWDISGAVVDAVTALTGDHPTDIDPLYESVDPDALNQLVDSARERDRENYLRVEFVHEDCHVAVCAGGDLVVRRTDARVLADD